MGLSVPSSQHPDDTRKPVTPSDSIPRRQTLVVMIVAMVMMAMTVIMVMVMIVPMIEPDPLRFGIAVHEGLDHLAQRIFL